MLKKKNFVYNKKNYDYKVQESPPSIKVTSKSDTVQPCDTTQVRSDSDFGVKCATGLRQQS